MSISENRAISEADNSNSEFNLESSYGSQESMARIIDLSIRDSNSPQMESIDEIQSDKRSSRSSVFKSHFAKYLPYSVVERFLEGKTLQEAEIKNFGAAVAFIDLSGFTKLSESLMTEHGPDGAEMLNRYVSSYFDILTTGIFQNGGDIIKFAGDAIQVVWKTKSQRLPDEIKNSGDSSLEGKKKNLANFFIGDQAEEEALHVHVLRAVHCTLELIRTLNNHNVGAEISLKLHAGIGCGKLKGIFVGGVENSWEYFIAGSPIKEMSDAADEAKIGELVLSKHAFECIENWVLESKVLSSGNARVMKIGDVPSIFQTTYPRITRIMEQSLLCFVPEIMRQRFLKQELLDLPGEYRKAFIMFVKLEDIDFEKPGALERLQESVCIVQQLVFLYEGFIARLIADDKGTRFKIVFGMPSQVHEDDSARVIITALEIEKRLKLAKMRCYIGIANGTVFCGEAGGSSRSEYTAVGFKVNIAARIMSIAQKTGLGLLCDEKTQVAGQQQSISFKPIPEKFTLKGVSEPVTLYRPIGKTKHFDMISHLHVIDSQADSKVNNVDTDASATPITTISNPLRKFSFQIRPTVIIEQKQGIVGRNIESLQIKQFLKGELSVEEQDVPIKAIILEGDVGIGKTQLILEAIEQAGKLGIEVFCAHGISLEKATPYRLWKSVFRQMFNLPSLSKQSIEKMLGDLISGGDKIKLPILNSMFDTQFPETNFSRSLTPDGRAEYMRQLFRTIIEKVTESNDKKILIVLEDMQWADLASWELAEEFIRCAKNSIIIIATRPLMKPIPPGYTNILKQEKITQKINLGPLSEDDGVRLACRILDVTTNALPQKVQEIIKQKAQGLPLYIKELVKSLLDQGFIQKNEDKTITVSDRLFRDDFNSFSDSIQQVITCRIDNLSANEQMTIKVCSVLGREVPLDLLLAVHPSISDRNKLKELVTSLIEAGFFCEESNEESSPGEKMEELFYFTSNLFMDVAYEMLLLEQRLQIHKKALEIIEKKHMHDRDKYCQILTHHALKADLCFKALDYSELAGMIAMEGNANEEAVRFLTIALQMHEKLNLRDIIRLENCHVKLGEALYSLGRYRDAMSHLSSALGLCGYPIPEGFHLAQSVFKMAARHKLKEILGIVTGTRKGNELASAYRASRMIEKLAQSAVLGGASDLAGYAAFKLINLCENVESQRPLLTVAYSLCGYTSLILMKNDLAEKFHQTARSLIMTYPNLPKLDMAMSKMYIAMHAAAHGDWEYALNQLNTSKFLFKTLGERKKWRECTLMVGIVLHIQCEFDECMKHFEKLLKYASEDGDAYLHANALFWKSITELNVSGSSMRIDHQLERAGTFFKDSHTDSLPLKITKYYNQFHLDTDFENSAQVDELDSYNEEKSLNETDDRNAHSRSHSAQSFIRNEKKTSDRVEAFVGRIQKELLTSPNLLWYNFYKYVHFLELICDSLDEEDDQRKKRKRIRYAEDTLKSFQRSYPFPFTKSYQRYLQGRLEWETGKHKNAFRTWLSASNEAANTGLPFVHALANYHIGRHTEGPQRSIMLEIAKKNLMKHHVQVKGHSQFPALDELENYEEKNSKSIDIRSKGGVRVIPSCEVPLPLIRKGDREYQRARRNGQSSRNTTMRGSFEDTEVTYTKTRPRMPSPPTEKGLNAKSISTRNFYTEQNSPSSSTFLNLIKGDLNGH